MPKGFRTHGFWMIVAGLMFMLGLHGHAWGVYHAIRAILIFLPHTRR